jgi:hypothetical protein
MVRKWEEEDCREEEIDIEKWEPLYVDESKMATGNNKFQIRVVEIYLRKGANFITLNKFRLMEIDITCISQL